MNILRFSAAVFCILLILPGCGGESVQDKFLRVAQERAKQKRALAEAEATAIKDQAEAPPPVEEPENASPQKPDEAEAKGTPAKLASAPTKSGTPPRSEEIEIAKPDVEGGPSARPDSEQVASPSATLPRRDELLAFGRLGEQVAYVGSNHQTIGVYNVSNKRIVRQLYNPKLSPFSLSISENGKFLAAGGMDGGLKIFPLESLDGLDKFQQNRLLRRDAAPPQKAHDGPVTAVAVSDAAGIAATGDSEGVIKIWSNDTTPTLDLTGNGSACVQLLSYQDDQLLFAATQKGVVYWQIAKKQTEASEFESANFSQSPTVMVPGLAGKGLAVGDQGGRVTIWAPENNQLAKTSFLAHNAAIDGLGFIDGGDSLVTVSRSGEVAKWSLPIESQRSFAVVDRADFVVTSPDQELLGVPSGQRNLDLYSLTDASAVRRHSLRQGQLTAATFSSDSGVVALADGDGRILYEDDKLRPLAFQQLSDVGIERLVRSPGNDDQFAFTTTGGSVGVANFPQVGSGSPSGVIGDLAEMNSAGTAVVVAKGSDLRVVQTSDGRITGSSRVTDGTVTSLCIDENLAIIGTSAGSIWIWPFAVADANAEALSKKVHEGDITAIGLTRFGSVWSCDMQGRTRQTPLARKTKVESGSLGFEVRQALALRDGSIVTLGNDGQVRTSSRFGANFKSIEGNGQVEQIIGDGDQFAAVTDKDRELRILTSDGQPAAPPIRVSGAANIRTAALAARTSAILLSDESAVAVSLPTGSIEDRQIPGGKLMRCIVSPDGQAIVSLDEAGSLYSSNIIGGGRKLELPEQANVRPLALSSAGRFLVVATAGRTLCYEISRQVPRMARVFDDNVLKPVTTCFSADASRVLFSLPSGELASAAVAGADAAETIATLEKPATDLFWDDPNDRILCRDDDGKLTVINKEGAIQYTSSEKRFSSIAYRDGIAVLGTADGKVYRLKPGDSEPSLVASELGDIRAISFHSEASAITVMTAAGSAFAISPEAEIIVNLSRQPEEGLPLVWQVGNDRLTAIDASGRVRHQPIPAIKSLAPKSSQLVKLAVSGNGMSILGLKSDGSLIRWDRADNTFSAPTPIAKPTGVTDMMSLGDASSFIVADDAKTLSLYSAVEDSVNKSIEVATEEVKLLAANADGVVVIQVKEDVQSIDFRKGTIDPVRSEFAKQDAKTQLLANSVNGRFHWLTINGDGRYVSADHISDQESVGSFSLAAAPTSVTFRGGFLFAALEASVDVYRETGTKFGQLGVADEKIACIAADAQGANVAACDDKGRMAVLNVGDKQANRFQLPIARPKSLVWSNDRLFVAATDGNRIVTIDSRSGKTDSQLSGGQGVTKLVGWQQGDIWFLDGSSRLTRMRPPRKLWTQGAGDEVSGVVWSAAGGEIIAITPAGNIVQLDAASGREKRRRPTGKTNLRGLVGIPNRDSVAMLAASAEVLIYDTDGQLAELPVSSGLGLRSLSASDDGRWLYASNDAGQIIAWDLGDLEKAASTIPCDVNCGMLSMAGGNRLVAVSSDEAKIALVPASMRLNLLERLGSQLTGVQVSGEGNFAAAADDSSTIQLISLVGGEKRQLTSDGMTFRQLAVAPGGTYVASLGRTSIGNTSVLVIWETIDEKQAARIELEGEARRLCYSRDGSLIAVAFDDGHVEVFDGISGNMLESVGPVEGLETMAFSQDGTKLLLGRRDGVVSVQSLMSLGRAKASESAIVSLSFHGGGKYLLCASMGGGMTLWNRAAFNAPQAAFQGLASPITHSKVSSDGRYVLAVYEDDENSTCVWDLNSSGSSAQTNIEPKLIIRSSVKSSSAAFTSDSKYLLIGGSDGMIRAWSLAESREIARFKGHEGPVMDVAPLSTVGHFVSGGIDHSIRSWRFPSSLPPPGAEIPEGALADATEVQDLAPPESVEIAGKEDPYDAARQALIAGAGTMDVLELMQGNENAKQEVKQSLASVLNLENDKSADAASLSRERRRLAAAQQRMAPSDDGQTLSSFSDGFSNLLFVAETNFKYGIDEEYRPVRLLFADMYLYAARPSVTKRKKKEKDEEGNEVIDVGDNGALLSWNHTLQMQSLAWSIEDLNVQELFPLPNSAGVFTVPQVVMFNQDGTSRRFPSIASWATSNQPVPNRQFLAVGTAGEERAEDDILKIFDVGDLAREEVSPYSQYRSFEGVVTAMAFANNSPTIAFAVRERAVHRLFVADAATLQLQKLEEIQHDAPWMNSGPTARRSIGNSKAVPGITSLAFSPDDELLIAHGHYSPKEYRFSKWELDWDEQGQLASFEKSRGALTNDKGPFFLDSGSRSVWFVTRAPEFGGDGGYKRIMVRVPDGFTVINLNSNRGERTINQLSTHHGWPEYAVSDDGRWLIMGDDNGMAYIWNTLTGDRYGLSIDKATENRLRSTDDKIKSILQDHPQRPAHSGPIVGVALSKPDRGRDYPAFAATIGEENRIKVWELFPILDLQEGLRSRTNEGTRANRQQVQQQ